MASSPLEQLREETRPAHLALEAQPRLKRLLSSRLTASEYGELLQSLLAFYQAIEPVLIPAAADLLDRFPAPDYRYFPRAPLLAEDCRVLGVVSSGFVHSPVHVPLDGDPQLLGVLYVLEGATQGGRVIAKHLAQTLGITERSGAHFFTLHQRDHSWAAFRRWFDTDLASSFQEDVRHMIDGADRTFAALHAHLDRWPCVDHGR